jgi:hypothetical protein
MKTIAPTPVLLFLAAVSVGACRTASRQAEVTPLGSQRSLALLVTFLPARDEPAGGAPGATHACPIKVENPSDGSQFLLRRSIQRDSVAQRDGGLVTHPYALGDYEPLTPGALAVSSREWLRLDCQTLRSVAFVPRGA